MIPLAQRKVALIDSEGWSLVSRSQWYAQTNAWRNGKRITRSMYNLLVGAGPGEMGDRIISTATLDNHRRNLRLCTNAKNQQSIGARGGMSPFEGVSWNA